MTATDAPSIPRAFELIRSRLCDPDFLNSRNLGNEVSYHVFPYEAGKEDEVRAQTNALIAESRAGDIPARIVDFDLWDVLLDICRDYDILEDLPGLEEREGPGELLELLQNVATPEEFVRLMCEGYEGRFGAQEPGRDVVLIRGVGKVYPFVRAHSIFENSREAFAQLPVVMLYPGTYDGQHLHLFGTLDDGNYYRAFRLI